MTIDINLTLNLGTSFGFLAMIVIALIAMLRS